MQKIYDKRVKEQKKEANKETDEVVDHEKSMLDEYKKTALKNSRFRMRQSGIDPAQASLLYPALNQTVDRNNTSTSILKESGSISILAADPAAIRLIDSTPDINEYRRESDFSYGEGSNRGTIITSNQVAIVPSDATILEDSDEDLSTLSDRSDLSEGQLDRLRMKQNNRMVTWEGLSFWDKAALFNKWSLFMCVGNLATIFGSLFYILSPYFDLPQVELFIGIGCAINWISVVRYFVLSR